MAADEMQLVAVMQMAIDEINESGGLLGRQVEALVRDGASSPDVFAAQARELLTQQDVKTLFGCWTSSSRKAVKPIVEEHDSLLWYPIQYEGLEQSSNVIYTGSCLNQQIEPAVQWALSSGMKRCFLVGSDYVFPRTANRLIRALVEEKGGSVLGESYLPLDSNQVEEVIDAITATRPDIVFNTINGDTNVPFFHEFQQAVGGAGDCPIMSLSFPENRLCDLAQEASGHYACWGYFQDLQTPENCDFLARYRQRFGSTAMASDPIVTAYTQVHLWKQIVENAGSLDTRDVLNGLGGSSITGPGGVMKIEPNHHVRKRALIGQATAEAAFDIVWSSESPVDPKPWLGIEDTHLPNKDLIIEAMSQYPEVLHLSRLLDQEISESGQTKESAQTTQEGVKPLNTVLEEHLHKYSEELKRVNEALHIEVAEHKQAKRKLEDTEIRSRTWLEYSPVCTKIVDLDFNLQYMSNAGINCIGIDDVTQFYGKPFPFDFYSERFRNLITKDLERVKQHGEIITNEACLTNLEGEEYWFQSTLVPVNNAEGQIDYIIVVSIDITDRKRSEAEREQLIAKLESQNTELERFAYTVSHDLKSPLITINGYIGMLRQDLAKENFERMESDLRLVSKATAKMDHLMSDLLELSRVGRLVNPSENVSLAELTHEALELVGGQAKQRGAQFDIAPDLPMVFGDRLRLREVLQNLIDNAVKYMGDQPQPRVKIGSRHTGDETIYYVQDNGIGIDPRYQQKIFGLFDQLDPHNPKVNGSGIGLSLVKRIIEVHGGRIWVESKGPGHGSTFCFTIATTN